MCRCRAAPESQLSQYDRITSIPVCSSNLGLAGAYLPRPWLPTPSTSLGSLRGKDCPQNWAASALVATCANGRKTGRGAAISAREGSLPPGLARWATSACQACMHRGWGTESWPGRWPSAGLQDGPAHRGVVRRARSSSRQPRSSQERIARAARSPGAASRGARWPCLGPARPKRPGALA